MSTYGEEELIDSEWAISVDRSRLRHGIQDRIENQFLLAREKRSAKWVDDISVPLSKARITPTVEELGRAKSGFSTKMLWVGLYAPHDRRPYQATVKSMPATVENSTKIRGAYEGKLLRVVTPLTKSTNAPTILYALVNPEAGLSWAHQITQSQCYYFNEFRELELRTMTERFKAWNGLIKAIAGQRYDAEPLDDNPVQALLRNFYDTSKPLDEAYAQDLANADHIWGVGVVHVTSTKLQDLHRWLWRSGLKVDSKCYQSFIALSMNEMDRNPTLWTEDVEAALQHNLLLAQAMVG